MLQPLDKRIIIKSIVRPKKESVLILKDESPQAYEVLSIGDEVTKVKVSDTILIAAYSTSEILYEGIKYTIVNESNIIAKVVS